LKSESRCSRNGWPSSSLGQGILGRELDKRLRKLEQVLPGVRESAPYWEDFERRCRIADLYRAWV
jgi:hypothetical protein